MDCLHPLESVRVADYGRWLHVFCRLCRKDLAWLPVRAGKEG